jgi:hypothetical protein
LSGRICPPAKQNNSAAWQRKVPLIKRGEMHIASVQFIISSVASSLSSIWAAAQNRKLFLAGRHRIIAPAAPR